MNILNKKFLIGFILIANVLFLGCNIKDELEKSRNSKTQPMPAWTVVVKVNISQSGQIFRNGEKVTLEQFKNELSALKGKNAGVLYYRENPESEPSPVAIAVTQAIIAAKLPVRLSGKPDFSDFVVK
jgi:hypothetical protein